MSDLAAALMVAIKVHAKQTDKQGEPYLLHVLRVVEAVSVEAKVVAALHDTLEDGGWLGPSVGVLVADVVGLSMVELDALKRLSREDGETYTDYIARLDKRRSFGDPTGRLIARQVKLVDLRDNLGRIPANRPREERPGGFERNWDSLRDRYERAIATLGAFS